MVIRKEATPRKIGITDAIKYAARKASGQDGASRSLWEETADIRALLGQYERTGLTSDKAFFDELSGRENEENPH